MHIATKKLPKKNNMAWFMELRKPFADEQFSQVQFGTVKVTVCRRWSHFINIHQVMSDSQFYCDKTICVLTPRQYCPSMSLITLHQHTPGDVKQSILLWQDYMCTHTQTILSFDVADHTSWTYTRSCQTVNFTVTRLYVYSHPDNIVLRCRWSHFMNIH